MRHSRDAETAGFERMILWMRDQGDVEGALNVMEQMKGGGYDVNEVIFEAALSTIRRAAKKKGLLKTAGADDVDASGSGSLGERGVALLREMGQSPGVAVTADAYNNVMTTLEKGGDWERALELFEEMKGRSVTPTDFSWSAAMCACEKGLQWQRCLEYLDEMTQVGMKKNEFHFGTALCCMEK